MGVPSEMVRICMDFPFPDGSKVVIARPYIPWMPEKWNGLLVLAESQNLSKTNADYVDWLNDLCSDEQVLRLHRVRQTQDLGIAPWDDGSLKLAVEAAFGEDANQTAVSNAVLWSQVTESNANKTPSLQLIMASAKLWSKLLSVLRPKRVITAGNVAHKVIDGPTCRAAHTFKHYKLRLPARTAMSRVSGMFRDEDLRSRYPEVENVIKRHPEWVEAFERNKVFYACHAVSLCGRLGDIRGT